MFSSQTYIQRRAQLKGKINSGILLFLGNEESPMNYADNTFPFRQDSTFLYYFGLQQAGLAAIIDFDSGEEILFGNDLTIDDIVWMGPLPTLSERAQQVGTTRTASLSELHKRLTESIKLKREIHFLPPYRADNMLKLQNWLGIPVSDLRKNASLELIKAVIAQREIKSAEELVEIERAVNTSVDMHVAAMQMIRPGITEQDITNRAHQIAMRDGGRLSFPIIATIHGETLHNHYHGNTLKEGDLFLIDCGAETPMGYAGDLSSTIPVSGKFTSRQKDIYELTLAMHEGAIQMLKPGTTFIDVYYQACRIMVNGLKDLGLMKGDTEDALKQGAHAMFFQCGLGHQMGLDVHDMEDLGEVYVGYDGKPKSTQFGLKSLRLGKALKPGLVLTIEPGIYFIPALMDMWGEKNKFNEFINYEKLNTYRDFGGIRNEEDFVITEDGYQLIGKPKPKRIEDVTSIVNG